MSASLSPYSVGTEMAHYSSTRDNYIYHGQVRCFACQGRIDSAMGIDGRAKCARCGCMNFFKAQNEELRILYERHDDWRRHTCEVICTHCNACLHIPKQACIYKCGNCMLTTVVPVAGNECNFSGNAVFGLTAVMIASPWLFWPFFFFLIVASS